MNRSTLLDSPAVRRAGLAIVAVAVVALAIMPQFVVERGQEGFVPNSLLFSFTQMFMLVTMAASWNLTGGFTGYVDFGHGVWLGIGAYGTGILMNKADFSFPLATAGGVVVSVLAALLIGSATLRLRGPYFSIAMLATFVAMREIVRIAKPLTEGGEGMTLPPYLNRPLFFYVTMVLAIVVVILTWWLRNTQFGSTLIAIREDEVGADMRGINTTLHKVTVFAISAAITGLVGGLWAYQNTFIDPDIVFEHRRTLDFIISTILGGLGTVAGPVIGAVAFYWLRDLMWSHFLHYHLIVTGGLLIVLVMWVPEGIVGSLSDRSGATTLGRLLHRRRRDQAPGTPDEPTEPVEPVSEVTS